MTALSPENPLLQWDQLHLDWWLAQVRTFPTLTVVLILTAGLVILLFGRMIFRVVIVLNAMLLAGYAGWELGRQINRPWLAAVGLAVVFGLLAWPLFKFGVAGLTGTLGSALVTQIGSLFPRAAPYWLIISAAGFVLFSVLSWFLLMIAVTVFTSLEGATFMVVAAQVLTERAGMVIPSLPEGFAGGLLPTHFAILILAVLGIVYQVGAAKAPAAAQTPPAKNEK